MLSSASGRIDRLARARSVSLGAPARQGPRRAAQPRRRRRVRLQRRAPPRSTPCSSTRSCAAASCSPARPRSAACPRAAVRPRRRRVPPSLRRAARLPGRAAGDGRAHHRRQPQADLPGVPGDHVQHGAVRRHGVAVRVGVRLQHPGLRRLRRADPARPAALPRRVPRQRAAQAGLDEPVQGRRRRARSRARSRCGSAGKATFEILWWDYTVGFDRTLIGGGGRLVTEVARRGRPRCSPRLGNPTSWRTELPPTADQLVGRRPARAATHCCCTRWAGSRSSQGVVPLNLARDIDRVGEVVPARARRFEITSATVGGTLVARMRCSDDFPDGQFFDLTDAERLAAPAFVRREAGVVFGNDAYRTDVAAAVPSPVRLHRDRDRARRRCRGATGDRAPAPAKPLPPHVFDAGIRIGAAGRAATRTGQ